MGPTTSPDTSATAIPPARGFDLVKLLWPVEPEAFFRDTWERKPLVVARKDPGYYAGLLTSRDVDEVIAFTRPKFLEEPGALLKTQVMPPPRFIQGWLPDEHAIVNESYPGVNEVGAAFARGKTLILTAMQCRWGPVAALCRNLDAAFECPTHANLYLTPPGSQGFNPHYDTHDVFVVQLEGNKHWRLYGTPKPLPTADDRARITRDMVGAVTQEFRLSPGDLLYMPRGLVHEAFTPDDCSSLHLTVGIRVYRWVDLLYYAVGGLAEQDVRFREALPLGVLSSGAAACLEDRFRELLQVLAQNARVEGAVNNLADRYYGSLGVLPDRYFLPPEDAERIDLDTVLERRPGAVCRVHEGPDWAGIQFPGNRVTGPAKIASALHFVARTPRFAPRALPDDLSDEAKLVLVKRLVRERLLTAAAAPGPVGQSPAPRNGSAAANGNGEETH
jgi:hypothetical protein